MSVRVHDLGAGPSVEELLRRAADRPGLMCLRGAFSGGWPVLGSHPVRTLPPGEVPTLSHVPRVPDIGRDAGTDTDVVGGGWFGVLGFDDSATRFAFHDHVVRLVGRRWRFEMLWSAQRDAELTRLREQWQALVVAGDADPGWTIGEFDGADQATHLAAVEHAVELIRAGEIYQVNVCTRLAAPFEGSAAGLFASAADRLDPAYGAFLDLGDGDAVACLSPELFLRRRGRTVRSEPIKGTLPDRAGNRDALQRSAKDVAENVMIVDLVRNDLGRVCATGTVRVERLLTVAPHVGVLHLVSRVAGVLRGDVGDDDLLAALFPPGSVTGAPKVRALEAIAMLEEHRRGAYTGAVGFVSPCWGAEFAVAIRTVEISCATAVLGVGGGVTADSVPVLEWRECLHKAAPIVAASGGTLRVGPGEPTAVPVDISAGVLETVLGLDGVPLRLADHLTRLDRSVRELWGRGLPDGTADDVRAVAARQPFGRAAIRVVVAQDAAPVITVARAADPPTWCVAAVVSRSDGSWRHKWVDRSWAVEAERVADGAAPLFLAADGTVLETSRGSVFLIEGDGTLVTPPLREDLLPGVTRRALLDHARDTGVRTRVRTFDVAELVRHPAFWTSSLSGAVAIHAVDGTPLPRADAVIARLDGVLRHDPGGGSPKVR